MKILLNKILQKNLYLLFVSVNKWKKNSLAIEFIRSLRFIQKLLRLKLKSFKDKKDLNVYNIKHLFKDYIVYRHIRPFFKNFLIKFQFSKSFKCLSKYILFRFVNKALKHKKNLVSSINSNVLLKASIDSTNLKSILKKGSLQEHKNYEISLESIDKNIFEK